MPRSAGTPLLTDSACLLAIASCLTRQNCSGFFVSRHITSCSGLVSVRLLAFWKRQIWRLKRAITVYSIGLEVSFRELMQVKWVAILPAPVGIALSILPGLETGKLFGWSTAQGVTVGALVAVASTMVLSKFLAERGELRSRQG